MSLYREEYRELNVRKLIKSIYEYKVLLLIITLAFTFLAFFRASTLVPIYKSEGLLKIGFYHEFFNDNFIIKPLDSAVDLSSKLTFVFVGKEGGDSWVNKIDVENEDRSNIQEYVRIESQGFSPEASANAIQRVIDYVQDQHGQILDKKNKMLEISLGLIDAEVDAINDKQENILADKSSYSAEEIGSVIKSIKLMSLIDEDIGINHITEKLQRKKYIELFLSEGYSENSSLVAKIYSPQKPVSPNKGLIILLGFFVGLFVSFGTIFLIKNFSEDS